MGFPGIFHKYKKYMIQQYFTGQIVLPHPTAPIAPHHTPQTAPPSYRRFQLLTHIFQLPTGIFNLTNWYIEVSKKKFGSPELP